jgi:hypothetical protein
LRRAAEQLLSSEGWRRWVRARASNGLARYSLRNQLLVALQSEGRATFVAGFKQWLRLGYCVKRGERALRILAPMTVQERDRETGEETGETTTFFRTVFVFFEDQVVPLPERDPVPLAPPREPLTGDSHVRLLVVSIPPKPGQEDRFCNVPYRVGGIDHGQHELREAVVRFVEAVERTRHRRERGQRQERERDGPESRRRDAGGTRAWAGGWSRRSRRARDRLGVDAAGCELRFGREAG